MASVQTMTNLPCVSMSGGKKNNETLGTVCRTAVQYMHRIDGSEMILSVHFTIVFKLHSGICNAI